MKYIICLHLDNKSSIAVSQYDDTCYIDVNLTPHMRFDTTFSHKNLLKMFKKELYSANEMDTDKVNLIQNMVSSEFDLVKEAQFISIDYQDGIKEYLDKNPNLRNKELHLSGRFNTNAEDLNMILDYFKDYKDIMIDIDGNESSITISDYEKTVNVINNIIDRIKKYNLSPLEQIMLAYDITRQHVYTKEEVGENANNSRDLTSVLFGEKIVCVGYTNIFDKILKNLGIKSMPYTVLNINSGIGHMRDLVYVDDDKYSIKGLFFFDPTWDSKKDDNTDYLLSYKFFCKTKTYMEQFNNYKDITLENYNECSCWDFEDIVDKDGLGEVPNEMIVNFNKISRFVDDKNLINSLIVRSEVPELLKQSIIRNMDVEKIKDDTVRYKSLFFDSYLSPDKLLKVLYNVRKIEYYEDPEKYPFDVESFRRVVNNNQNINRALFLIMYGEICRMSNKEFEDFERTNELEKNIERVKFARTLKKVYEQKINKN